MLIGGDWVQSQTGKQFTRESPAHDITVGRYPMADQIDTDFAVAAARHAFDSGPWPKISGADRSKALLKVAEGLRAKKEELALIEVL